MTPCSSSNRRSAPSVWARPAQWVLSYWRQVRQANVTVCRTRVMIHQPLGGYQGQATDIEIHAQEILKVKARMNDLLAHHTGKSVEEIQRDTERDRFLSAKEAQEYGLVDHIYTHR